MAAGGHICGLGSDQALSLPKLEAWDSHFNLKICFIPCIWIFQWRQEEDHLLPLQFVTKSEFNRSLCFRQPLNMHVRSGMVPHLVPTGGGHGGWTSCPQTKNYVLPAKWTPRIFTSRPSVAEDAMRWKEYGTDFILFSSHRNSNILFSDVGSSSNVCCQCIISVSELLWCK